MDLPLKYEDIIRIIPHRYPFLFVDKIVEMELGKRQMNRFFKAISRATP